MLSKWRRAVPAHIRNDRISRLIAAFGVGVTACLTLLGAYLILDLRDGAWRQAEQNAQNLLGLIEEGVARNIEMYDLSLQAVATLASRPDVTALPPELRRLALFDHSATAAGLGRIVLTDAAGRVRLTSSETLTTGQSLADLPEFATLRDDPNAGLVISGPRLSRISGRAVMGTSRRISNPDGSFGGIVSGAIHLAYFQALFARLQIAEGNAVNLFHADGVLLAKFPYEPSMIGRSIVGGTTYQAFRKDSRGLFVGWSQLGQTNRLYAFANLGKLPLIVNVAVGLDGIRAAWLSKAIGIGVLIFGLCCVTVTMTVVLQREVARRAAAEASSRAANAELSRLVSTDSLTGLANRRRYDEAFAQAWRDAAYLRSPIALLLLDADHFKHFNDHFGHHRGDAVLRALAGCVLSSISGIDAVACRIGGEEFAVVLSGLSLDEARLLAERIRHAVIHLQIPHAPEIGGVATISIGLAQRMPSGRDDPASLFAEADAALYAAKRAGRNRVRAAASEPRPAPVALSA